MYITREQIDFVRRHLNDRPRAKYIAESRMCQASFYRLVRQMSGEMMYGRAVRVPGIEECVTRWYPTMSAREIHERFGYARTTVTKWARRLGVKNGPEKVARLKKERIERFIEAHMRIDYAASARKRKARWRLDEYRVWQGLPQRTKLKLKTITRRAYKAKWYLCKKYGYVPTAEPYTLLVVAGTRRCGNEEAFRIRYNLRFKEGGL